MPIKKYCTLGFLLISLTLPTLSYASDYTLSEAVERALVENPKIDAAKMNVESAKYDIRSAYGALGPSVSTTYSATRVDMDSYTAGFAISAPNKTPVHGTNFSWSVAISQPLFAGFALLSQVEQAKLSKDSQDLQFANAKLQLISAVQVAFIEFLRSEENIKSTQRAIDRAKEQLALTKAAYDVGLRPHLEVLQAEVDLARLENTLIQVLNAKEVYRSTLKALLAIPQLDQANFTGTLQIVPFDRSIDDCIASAMENRPELKLGQLAVDLATTGKKLAYSAYYPQVGLQAGYNQNGDAYKKAGDSSAYSIGIGVTLNLFTGGQRINKTKQADLAISRTQYELEDAKNNVASTVTTLFMTAFETKKRIAVSEQAVDKAMQSYEAAKARYELGVGTNLDVLLAQSNLATEEATYNSALADYLLALSKLHTAMGETYYIGI